MIGLVSFYPLLSVKVAFPGYFKKRPDIYSVAGLSGYEDINSAQRYAHLGPEILRSTIQKLNLGDNMATVEKWD